MIAVTPFAGSVFALDVCRPISYQCPCRMQEVGIHPLVPAETLRSSPLDNAVALLPLADVASANGAGVELPPCSTRMAVTVDGTESDEQIAALKVSLTNQVDA